MTTMILERIGLLTAKADAAHTRIDKLEKITREDLKEIKDDLKTLSALVNRASGWAAAFIFIGGLVGGAGLVKLASTLFH